MSDLNIYSFDYLFSRSSLPVILKYVFSFIPKWFLVIDPKIDETVYDPGCGTGGFLAQSFTYIRENLGNNVTPDQLEILKERAFWGREKENLIYPIALANLVLHGIDRPNLWHGNTLTGQEIYGGLFEGAPPMFDVILTDIKVREKTLLTLKHFDNFFKLLHTRADSELSWTVDLDEHKKRAADDARPFNEKARQEFQEAAQGKERLKELKKTKSKDEKDIQEAKTCFDMNEIWYKMTPKRSCFETKEGARKCGL